MIRREWFLLLSVGVLLTQRSSVSAVSSGISPSFPSVAVGQSVQFSALLSPVPGSALVWGAGGSTGGSAKAGAISQNGLYTAPAVVPAQNPVQIVASSGTVSVSTYLSVLAPGPSIISVTPNPLRVGNYTASIQGSGFQAGATVVVTSGSGSVQMSSSSVSPTSIVALGYQGPGTSATFCVRNPGSAYSNSITVPVGTSSISPSAPSLPVGQTLQFTALLAGVTSGGATWSAGGVVGGNPKVGTIASTGGYTAPASMPSQNPVQIIASNGSASASTYVTILAAGPTITAASPNPLPVGSYTATIQGSGFQPGAAVFVDSGGGGVQLSSISVNPSSITALGYQGPATSATFTVKNPGSAFSNSLTVPVGNGSVGYSLTVVGGAGSGTFTAGTVVTIMANVPTGQAFGSWSGAAVQSAAASTTTITMPAANTTVTANYITAYTLTVVAGVGGGSYPAGSVVTITANPPSGGTSFSGWTGASVLSASSPQTTLTMPAVNTTLTANYTATTIPFPVSGHPRLWLTGKDLPHLQSWATAGNSIYQQGIVPLLNQAVSVYQTQFFPNGAPNPNYPDPGDTQGYTGLLTEEYAVVLAFNSLIDSDPGARIHYAQYARNLFMYAMNQAARGHLAGAPFRDPMFATYNRANGTGEEWPLVFDWIYNACDDQGTPLLSANDKLTVRNVFLLWASDCLNATTEGGDHPAPIGVTNSLQLLPGNLPYRLASNNYYLGHARLLTMMALSIDPGDDPPVVPNSPSGQLGNSLRSYIPNATGAWLFQEFAMMGDPMVVANAYRVGGTGAGFGLASGGLPPEGMLYGHSFGFLLGQLLALQTAGFNSVGASGPQIKLIGAPVWDRYVAGFLASLTPAAQIFPTQSYLGPLYQFASYGDLLRLWATPEVMQPFSLLALLEQQNGQTTHLDAARWIAVNAPEGGAANLMTRINQPWSYSPTASILYYLLLDPGAPAAPDPRPSLPTTFYDAPAGRLLARTDWTANATLFNYRASWNSIDHQLGDGGQFELFRKGEWLTKEMSNYDSNDLGLTTVYHNTLSLQNWCANGTPNLNWFEPAEWASGSQWILGLNAGDPTTIASAGLGYAFAASNLTNLYNRPNIYTPTSGATNVTQATRSILWLNSDYIVIYDRATTLNSGLFKRFNLSMVTSPAISGNVATETLASGQQLFLQTVLPSNPSMASANLAPGLNAIAQLEPTQYVVTVEDPARPKDARFLHVLQGADPGAPMATATYLQSAGGTGFDGAAFGSAAVFFPVFATTPFLGASFSVPTGIHTMLVTGLAPNASFTVTVSDSGSGKTIGVAPTGTDATTDAAGLLRLTF